VGAMTMGPPSFGGNPPGVDKDFPEGPYTARIRPLRSRTTLEEAF